MVSRLNKIKTMSAHELLFRARTQLYLRCERIRHSMRGSELDDEAFWRRVILPEGRRGPDQSDARASRLFQHMRTRQGVRFYFDHGDKEPLVEAAVRQWPALIDNAVKTADTICRHEFSFLGISVKYGEKILWTADPLSSNRWPSGFHTTINIFGNNGACGDVKHVWELNRHQFFVELGKAFWLTGDEKYARELFALMSSWIDQNPWKTGINWTSGLEVAVRAISWIWAYMFCLHSRALDPQMNLAILKSLYQHGQFLHRHLSFYFSPYNHLIGEAAALHMIGTVCPEFREARKWKDNGWNILEHEVDKQFYADGFTVEQASFYHHFTLGFYLLAALLRRSNGESVRPRTWELIEKATEVSMFLAKPDGVTPMIGDADDARSIYVENPPLWDFRAFYSTGAVLFSRGDMKKLAMGFHEDSLWLLGIKGLQKYLALEERCPEKRSRVFRESGYCVMRTGWDEDAHYLSLDCGQIADGVPRNDLPSAAHGHADALSIELSAWGQSMLVDPGFYTYNGDPEWHRYFRETEAHNTLVLDGQSQAKFCGRLKWSRAPQVELHHWMSSRTMDYADGSHDGYRNITKPGIHKRAVAFMKPDYWLIRDDVLGEGEHQVDRYFHFAPVSVVSDADAGSCRTASSSGANLAVISIEKDGVTTEILENGNGPGEGWLATSYGKKVRAPIVRYRAVVHLPMALHTLLVPFREQMPNIEVSSAVVGTGHGQVISVKIGERQDFLVFSSADGVVRFHNGWQLNGCASLIRLDGKGRVLSCALIDGSMLRAESDILLQLSKKVRWAVMDFQSGDPVITLSEPAQVTTSFSNPRVVISREWE